VIGSTGKPRGNLFHQSFQRLDARCPYDTAGRVSINERDQRQDGQPRCWSYNRYDSASRIVAVVDISGSGASKH
jgi:hypothetical protein